MKNEKRWKRSIAILLLCALLFILGACNISDEASLFHVPGDVPTSASPAPTYPTTTPVPVDSDETWAIYWYLCGTDLESTYGFASEDLEEMRQVSLPSNVQVIVQAGGTKTWKNNYISEDYMGRYLYDANHDMELVDQQPLSSMGDADTLAAFLEFCSTNYPADHTMVLFWNHRGGSVSGVAFDELFNYDSLTLVEMYQAFHQVYDLSEENPPLELVGFDCCLMATIDTAFYFSDIARYMVASEEVEPGNGWYYTGWLQALAQNPEMDGAQLGRIICDTYVEGCEMVGTEEQITMSTIDLQQAPALLLAYEAMGEEALTMAYEDPYFMTDFGRLAVASESYGGNSPEYGYSNMVDLGHLAENTADLLPETSQAVLDALEARVVYKVNSYYRPEASGLSCYYSYDGDVANYEDFADISASRSFVYFYGYELGSPIVSSPEGQAYMEELGIGQPEISVPSDLDLENYPLYVNDDGCAVLDVGPDVANMLKGVYFHLAYFSQEDDVIIMLGRDNNLYGDWAEGVFWDNFWGYWAAIDGMPVYMELVYEGDGYNLYTVPILLDDEAYNLNVVYDFDLEEYQILGARKAIDDAGMADRALIQLQPGDAITLVYYAATFYGDDAIAPVPLDTITIREDTVCEDIFLGDGDFVMMFEMVDVQNNSYLSDMAFFHVEGNNIYTEVA